MVDATQVQIRRGTEAQISGFVPVEGEVICDLTNDTLRVGDGTKAGGHLMPNVARMQSGQYLFATAGGTANAITVNLSPAVPALTIGMEFRFLATANNTGATTLNLNGLGAIGLRKISGGSAVTLASGDISSGVIYSVVYDGTYFILLPSASPEIPDTGVFLLDSKVISSGTTLSFTASNFTDYKMYRVEVSSLAGPAGGNSTLSIRAGTSSGSLWTYRKGGTPTNTNLLQLTWAGAYGIATFLGSITFTPGGAFYQLGNYAVDERAFASKAGGGNFNYIELVSFVSPIRATASLYGIS